MFKKIKKKKKKENIASRFYARKLKYKKEKSWSSLYFIMLQ